MARRTRPIVVTKSNVDLIERRRAVLDALNGIERGISKLDAFIVGPTERRVWDALAHAYNELIDLGTIAGCNNYVDECESESRRWEDERANDAKPRILALWQNMEKAGVNADDALMGAAWMQFRVNQRKLYSFMQEYQQARRSGDFSFFTGEAKSKLRTTKYAEKLDALHASSAANVKFPVNGTLDERIAFIVDRTPDIQWDVPDADVYRDANASRDTFIHILGVFTRNGRDKNEFALAMPDHPNVSNIAVSLEDYFQNHINAIIEACFLDRNNPGHNGKLTAVKRIREALTLGFKEAKDIVDPFWNDLLSQENA